MSHFQLLALAPLLAMLCIAAVMDWRTRRLPNWLTVLMMISGIASSFFAGHVASPWQALLGVLLGFAIAIGMLALNALGGGDVKLLMGLGAWVGPIILFKIFIVETIVGMIIVLIQAAFQKRLSALFRNSAILSVSLINIDSIGADAVCETGHACRSIERPLPYAVPVLVAVLIVVASC